MAPIVKNNLDGLDSSHAAYDLQWFLAALATKPIRD
jgi:hypothetical protein